MTNLSVICDSPDILGESPIWCPRRECLFWIDVEKGRIRKWDAQSGRTRTMVLSGRVGAIALAEDNRLITAMRAGFGVTDFEKETFNWIGDNAFLTQNAALNDGKLDNLGRFWNAGLQVDPAFPPAGLYCLNRDLTVRSHDHGYRIGNGIAFSPDYSRLYACDTKQSHVFVFDFHPETGQIANKRVFVTPGNGEGRVDGATCDRDGNYWCAMVGGGAIHCYSPDGRLLDKIDLPVPLPTMVMFGGQNYDEMFITTSRFRMTSEQTKLFPDSGKLFHLTGLGAGGWAEPRFSVANIR